MDIVYNEPFAVIPTEVKGSVWNYERGASKVRTERGLTDARK
jgi:hypothetical protein